MSKVIAIAGLGWLGLPLVQHVSLLGYTVKGSVTTPEKAGKLQQAGIDAYPFQITEKRLEGEVEALLKNVDVLAIMIPPGLRRNTGADYVLKMSHFLTAIQTHKVPKVILVSSTSVYADDQGKVTEKDIPQPDTEAGKQLFQVEQLFQNATGIQTAVVRFGGLIGGSRQPVRYLAGRKDLSGGLSPVNLIQRGDCIRILSEIIKQDAFGHVFNAVHPNHPIKKDYYQAKALELGLEPPQFSETTKDETFKEVHGVHIETILDYPFKYDI